jgi:hypothetical protein
MQRDLVPMAWARRLRVQAGMKTCLLASSIVAAVALASVSGCRPEVQYFVEDQDEGCVPDPWPSYCYGQPTMLVNTCIDGQSVLLEVPCDPDTPPLPTPPCPELEPSDGTACPSLGQICQYEYETGECDEEGDYYTESVQCTAQGWTTISSYCMPLPECPEAPPVAGSDCTGWEDSYWCDYPFETACGESWMSAWCEWDGTGMTWQSEMVDSCASCAELGSAALCAAAEACRWLEPGCGESPLGVAGCFPAADCQPEGCGEGESCQSVSVDPCWLASCNTCSADASVCLPAPAP